jgi:esterase/lipase
MSLKLTSKEHICLKSYFNKDSVGVDLDEYLRNNEKKIPNIKAGVEKRIIWSNKKNTKTPISIIYIHGFSASSEEARPLPDMLANELKSNIFYTRLSGHGRDKDAMNKSSIKEWVKDLYEAIEIGTRIGNQIIIMSTSTGGTLSSIAAIEPKLSKNILGFIFVSPNFGINHKLASLITWPLSEYWLSLIIGKTIESKARNDLNAKFWTLAYPTNALIPMAKLVKKIKKQDFSKVKIPALFYFSLDDKVVKPDKTLEFIQKWGGKSYTHNVTMSDVDDNYSHVVIGDIISPNQTEYAFKVMINWINNVKSEIRQ